MDARRIAQRIVAIFLVGSAFCFPAFADLAPIIYSQNFNLPLLDPNGSGSAMTEAIIDVPDHFVIADLDVQINITHTCVFDLQLILQGPDGKRVCLNKYEFMEIFEGENYTNTVFDDEAEISIEDANPPFTGHFKPEAGYLLEIFDGTDAYGPWLLQIYDMWPTDTGTLDRLDLIFNIPELATVVLLLLGTGLALLIRPCRCR